MATSHKTAVIIGSGFGGSMAGLCLADEFKKRGRGETILMLERGTWWTTPVSTVEDKEVATYDFLVRKQQPVQHWSSQNHFRGAVDLLTRCFRRPGNEDGLYEFTPLGKPGFLGLFGRDSDGVSVLRCERGRRRIARLFQRHDPPAGLRVRGPALAFDLDGRGTQQLLRARAPCHRLQRRIRLARLDRSEQTLRRQRSAVAPDQQRPQQHRDAIGASQPALGGETRSRKQPWRQAHRPRSGHSVHQQALDRSGARVPVGDEPSDHRLRDRRSVHQRSHPGMVTRETVTADTVVVSAGVMGTNEIMLRSKAGGGLPNLSDRLGFGFSTNGDYISYLEKTREWVSLTRGPVTTSYGRFNTEEPGTGLDPSGKTTFHTLEDQGVPPAFATVTGQGVPLFRSLENGRRGGLLVLITVLRHLLRLACDGIRELFTNHRERGKILFRSEEEVVGRMMCVTAMGLEGAVGQFRLGGPGETPLRVKCSDGLKFSQDPIYDEIRKSLSRLAEVMRDPGDPKGEFINPFASRTSEATGSTSIALSHPLGGCRMAKAAADGVVDEFGRVFDKTKTGERPYYEGLYVVDGSIIATALGVNPYLTITALSLRAADRIMANHRARRP